MTTTSESIKEIASALCEFQTKIGIIKKTEENPFFKSKYASLSSILDAIAVPLSQVGLSITQFPVDQYGLETILMHKSGEWIKATYFIEPTKKDPQGAGSALTYSRRYALGAILSLNIDEDDDGNAASRPVSKKADEASKVGGSSVGNIWKMKNGNYGTCFISPKTKKTCYSEHSEESCDRNSFVKWLKDYEFDSQKVEQITQ